jgi:probable F420-dependent oxidoreductase
VSVAAERPFRFACRVTGGLGRTAAEWVALALRAESLGYATFGVADHVATYYAPMPLLQLVAAHTSRIRLATLVLDNDFRHPVMLAKEAATLDVLSGGRLELGLGAGWLVDDYHQTGIPFATGAARLAKLQEAVQLLKLLFGDAPTWFEGRFYSVHDVDGRPKPVQKPHPPLLLGGTRQRLLRFAAGIADIVSFDSGPISSPES